MVDQPMHLETPIVLVNSPLVTLFSRMVFKIVPLNFMAAIIIMLGKVYQIVSFSKIKCYTVMARSYFAKYK